MTKFIYMSKIDLYQSIHQNIHQGSIKVSIAYQRKRKKGIIKLKNPKDYPTKKNRKVLIVFDNIIADMEANKKLIPIITESNKLLYYENIQQKGTSTNSIE